LEEFIPRIVVEDEDGEGHGEIVRPLLGIRRRELEQYLADVKQAWREDSTNADAKFTRNPRAPARASLAGARVQSRSGREFPAELAEIARDEEDYWENEISGWLALWCSGRSRSGCANFRVSALRHRWCRSRPLRLEADPEVLARIEESSAQIMNASVSRPWAADRAAGCAKKSAEGDRRAVWGFRWSSSTSKKFCRFAAEDGPAGKELVAALRLETRPGAGSF